MKKVGLLSSSAGKESVVESLDKKLAVSRGEFGYAPEPDAT